MPPAGARFSAKADFGGLLKRLLVRPARKSASKIIPPSFLEKYIEAPLTLQPAPEFEFDQRIAW